MPASITGNTFDTSAKRKKVASFLLPSLFPCAVSVEGVLSARLNNPTTTAPHHPPPSHAPAPPPPSSPYRPPRCLPSTGSLHPLLRRNRLVGQRHAGEACSPRRCWPRTSTTPHPPRLGAPRDGGGGEGWAGVKALAGGNLRRCRHRRRRHRGTASRWGELVRVEPGQMEPGWIKPQRVELGQVGPGWI